MNPITVRSLAKTKKYDFNDDQYITVRVYRVLEHGKTEWDFATELQFHANFFKDGVTKLVDPMRKPNAEFSKELNENLDSIQASLRTRFPSNSEATIQVNDWLEIGFYRDQMDESGCILIVNDPVGVAKFKTANRALVYDIRDTCAGAY